LDGKFGAISKDSLKEFSENAQMEKTNDGYIISGSSDYAKMLEEIIESLGLAESLGTEVSEALSSLKIESFNIKYTITNDYEIENAHIDFKATMSVDDQEVAMDLNLDMNIKTYDQTQIKYPDFSEWDNPSGNEDVSSVSCSYEGEGISELMMMHAEDDTVVEIESYMVVDYATYDIGSDEEKEAFHKKLIQFITTGVVLIIFGMILAVTLDAVISANHMIRNRIDFDALGGAIFMFLVTIAVILFVYAGTQDSKYNIEQYNLMHDHSSQTYKNGKKIGIICGSIMMVATMIFLGCGFLGNLWHSAWVVYPIFGIACGIVSMVINRNNEEEN